MNSCAADRAVCAADRAVCAADRAARHLFCPHRARAASQDFRRGRGPCAGGGSSHASTQRGSGTQRSNRPGDRIRPLRGAKAFGKARVPWLSRGKSRATGGWTVRPVVCPCRARTARHLCPNKTRRGMPCRDTRTSCLQELIDLARKEMHGFPYMHTLDPPLRAPCSMGKP